MGGSGYQTKGALVQAAGEVDIGTTHGNTDLDPLPLTTTTVTTQKKDSGSFWGGTKTITTHSTQTTSVPTEVKPTITA